jgi:hypothetical protein
MIDRFRSDPQGLERLQKTLDTEQSIEEFLFDEHGSAQKAFMNNVKTLGAKEQA